MEFACLGTALQELAKSVKMNFSELAKLMESIQIAYSDFHNQISRVRQDHSPAHLTCGYDRPEQFLCAFADQLMTSLIEPVHRLRNGAGILREFGSAFSAEMDHHVSSAAESNSELRNAIKVLRGQVVKAASTMSLQDHRQVARQTR
jgi:hypothetical protein